MKRLCALGLAAALGVGCGNEAPVEASRSNCTASSLYGAQGETWSASGRLLDY